MEELALVFTTPINPGKKIVMRVTVQNIEFYQTAKKILTNVR
jgi:hypothetical protein